MNEIFDRCPFCNKAAIETETNEKRFEIYAFCSECDEILDITDYIPNWELHGYLEREYRVFIPRQRTKKNITDPKFKITDNYIEVLNNPTSVVLTANLQEGGWYVSDGYEGVFVETKAEAIKLLKSWYDDTKD